MSHVFPRDSRVRLPVAVAGDGCYLIDSTGKRYFDGSGGAAVSCLGHNDPDVIAAVQSQIGSLAYAHTGFFTSEPAEDLARQLTALAPEGIERVYFLSGGSEVIEAALKLARQYFLEIGETARHRVIARRQSYHGNTLGALAAGGSPWRRQPFEPLLIETSHIAPCYEYRLRQENETALEYGRRAADELEAEILRLGAENVMAFIAEPVAGATAGAVPAVAGYFQRIREICDTHGVLLVLDEVMCGMGRTGTLFACEADGIAPDILCIAKGLGGGYQPLSAMLCSARIYQAIEEGSGFFQHGHTYMGHPTACAAGRAVLAKLVGQGLVQRSREMGDRLQDALVSAFGQHPHIGDIRGRGLFRGIEIVQDRETKEPFSPDRKIHAALKQATFDAGLICYPMGGTLDGVQGDHILLAPPFILDDSQIDEITDKIGQALQAVLPRA